jgi:hypothetical protein
MATFFLPGDLLQSVTSSGAGAPPTGFYKATVKSIENHPTRPTSRRMNLVFETGFATFDWANSPCDIEGNILPGLSDKQVRGMAGHIKTLLESAGYTHEQMADGASDDWLAGSTVHLEWHSAKDLGAQYGRIVRYIKEDRFVALKDADAKPAIAEASKPAAPVSKPAAPAPAPLPPVATATVAPTPTNGASRGPRLPPPPGARGVVR